MVLEETRAEVGSKVYEEEAEAWWGEGYDLGNGHFSWGWTHCADRGKS